MKPQGSPKTLPAKFWNVQISSIMEFDFIVPNRIGIGETVLHIKNIVWF